MTTLTKTLLPTLQDIAHVLGTWMTSLAQNAYNANGLARDIEALNQVSDETLAARGTTRQRALRDLANRYGYI